MVFLPIISTGGIHLGFPGVCHWLDGQTELTSAMTDIMHDVWTCSTDDAQMGAITDK